MKVDHSRQLRSKTRNYTTCYDEKSSKPERCSVTSGEIVKIDLLKYHSKAIPVLSKLWCKMLGQWSPNVQVIDIEMWLHEWLNDSIPLSYIALDGDIPFGMCSLQLNDGIRSDLMPWIGDLCVDPDYQNRGVGKLLIEASQQKARELGFDKLYLFTPDLTIPNYYERLGWRKIGMDIYHGHPVTVMEIKL